MKRNFYFRKGVEVLIDYIYKVSYFSQMQIVLNFNFHNRCPEDASEMQDCFFFISWNFHPVSLYTVIICVCLCVDMYFASMGQSFRVTVPKCLLIAVNDLCTVQNVS